MTAAAISFEFKPVNPTGMPLDDFEHLLAKTAKAARDFVAPCEKFHVEHDEKKGYSVEVDGVGEFGMRPMFHNQLATRCNVPLKFYERAQQYPKDFVPLLNTLLREEWGSDALIRTLSGDARALLSSKYSIFDNMAVAQAVVPAIREMGEFQVKSVSLSETKMYMKFVFPGTRTEVAVGDTVESGVIVSNSEVGMGAVSVRQFMHRLVCLNGAVIDDAKFSRRHSGKSLMGDDGSSREIFQRDTIEASQKALQLQIRDMVLAAANPSSFASTVERIKGAQTEKLVNPEKAVKQLVSTFSLTETESGHIFRHLIEGGDVSRWGLVNAVTAAAKDSATYDRATELETVGGGLLGLRATEWNAIAAA